MTICDAITSYLDECRRIRRLSDKTIRAYRCDLEQFACWLDSLHSHRETHLANAYVGHLNASFAPKTVRRKIASVRAFARSGHAPVHLAEFESLHAPSREPKVLPRVVSLSDLQAMFLVADREARAASGAYSMFMATRLQALLELLLATGIRISELCDLSDDALDLGDRTLTIMGKGSKERVIQLECDATLRALRSYLRARDVHRQTNALGSGYLFISRRGLRLSEQAARSALGSLARRANATRHVTPHMLRHTFATLLLEQDVDIRYIQRLLGHSSLRTTEIYTHVTSAKQREILRKKNPRGLLC